VKAIQAIGDETMATLLNGLWQGAVLTALVWAMLKIIPRTNAATRYLIWWVTLAAVVILPLRARSFQSHDPTSPRPVSPLSVEATDMVQTSAGPIAARESLAPSPPVPDVSEVAAPSALLPIRIASLPVSIAIAILWATLSLALLIRLARSFQSLRQLKSHAEPAGEVFQSRLNSLAASVGVGRRARLLVSDDVSAPMALGLLDPVILVPRSLPERLSDADFDHVALHELAHLRRYDDWMNLLQRLIEALFPIQPAVFWISRQLTLERESACDDWVIAATGTPKPYATTLTRVAELTMWARAGVLASGAAGNPSQLYRRVHRLLDQRRNITPRASAIALLLGALGVVALVSACARAPQLVAVADSTTTTSPSSNESAPSAPISKSGTLPAQAGTQTRSFAVQAKEKLHVDVDRGEVLVSTWDKPEAKIVVTQKGRDIEEFLKHHTITITQENHEVRVNARADRSMPSSVSDVRIEYQISIPRQFDADIAISLGRLELADLKGQLKARISLGEVKLTKVDGPVNVQMSQGAVKVADCTGGALRASASQGWVEINRFSGPAVNANVSQGNVGVEMTAAPTGDCSVTSSQGNVSVTLPATAGVNLTAATSMGTIHSDLPVKSQEHGVTGGSMQGPINGGGPALNLTTSMGNIRISKP
jgi:beta-lactamase regulating signal transducer with metallopeptidase domain/DUF4097 and DUF4098 domain-containing protein YvlB